MPRVHWLPLAARCRRLPLDASNCDLTKLVVSAKKECAPHNTCTDTNLKNPDSSVCRACHLYGSLGASFCLVDQIRRVSLTHKEGHHLLSNSLPSSSARRMQLCSPRRSAVAPVTLAALFLRRSRCRWAIFFGRACWSGVGLLFATTLGIVQRHCVSSKPMVGDHSTAEDTVLRGRNDLESLFSEQVALRRGEFAVISPSHSSKMWKAQMTPPPRVTHGTSHHRHVHVHCRRGFRSPTPSTPLCQWRPLR